jgi:outer membrane immunogenic protein
MAASLASATSSPAAAADLASIYAAPMPSVAFNWAGAYVGATLGYERGSVDNDPTIPKGVAGGFEVGNWQYENFVYGGETEIGFAAADDKFAPWQFSNPWFGAELGFAHWSVTAERFYFELDDRRSSRTAANNGLAANLVRLGLNDRF